MAQHGRFSSKQEQLCDSFQGLKGSEVDLLLIGKTGNGKSATGNTILRKPKRFKAMPTTQSVTTEIQFDYSVFDGRTIKVVDEPGVGDTRMSNEESLNLVQQRLMQAITANPDGYHAFLLVVRYGGRFTKEDVQTVECLKKIFGMDFVKKFCIIVVTCGDIFDGDIEETGMNFDQWLQAQSGVFKTLLVECNRRVVLFDNKTKDETSKEGQVARLISMADSLGGKRYTDRNFEKARYLREKQMIESKEPRVREETRRETVVLNQKLKDVQRRDPLQQIGDLKELMTRANKLYQHVNDQDQGTGVLEHSIQLAQGVLTRIKSDLNHCQARIEDQRRAENEIERLRREMEVKLRQQRLEQERRMAEERAEKERQREEERENFRRLVQEERERRQREERSQSWWEEFQDYQRKKNRAREAGYRFEIDPRYELCQIL